MFLLSKNVYETISGSLAVMQKNENKKKSKLIIWSLCVLDWKPTSSSLIAVFLLGVNYLIEKWYNVHKTRKKKSRAQLKTKANNLLICVLGTLIYKSIITKYITHSHIHSYHEKREKNVCNLFHCCCSLYIHLLRKMLWSIW